MSVNCVGTDNRTHNSREKSELSIPLWCSLPLPSEPYGTVAPSVKYS